MARIYGLNGVLRGRQGNNVFAVQNGTQIVRAYQPVVANPRTDAQQLVRARFALAGKLSSATPNEALLGMLGQNRRSRRARFVSKLAKAAVASISAGSPSAQVPFTDMVFSMGSLARYSGNFTTTAAYTEDSTWIDVWVPQISVASGAPAGYGEIIVCGIFDGAGSPLDKIQAKVRPSSGTLHFSFRQNVRNGFVAVVWIVPFVADDAQVVRFNENLGITDTHDAALLSSNPLSLVGVTEYGQSMVNDFVWVAAPSQAVNPNRDEEEVPTVDAAAKRAKK